MTGDASRFTHTPADGPMVVEVRVVDDVGGSARRSVLLQLPEGFVITSAEHARELARALDKAANAADGANGASL